MGPQKLWISARLWNKMVMFGRMDWMDKRRYEAWDLMESFLWEMGEWDWAKVTNR